MSGFLPRLSGHRRPLRFNSHLAHFRDPICADMSNMKWP